MERKHVVHRADDIRLAFDTTLDSAIAELQKIKDEFITDGVVNHVIELEHHTGMLEIITYRDETDEEYAFRLNEEMKRNQRQQEIIDRNANTVSYLKDEEYELFLKLKNKYEK